MTDLTSLDLVERLRAEGESAMRRHLSLGMHQLCAEAADEILRLRALTAPGEGAIEAAAKIICKWIGYDWDGTGERDISVEFPDWASNGIGHRSMQGGKPALRKIAAAVLTQETTRANEAAARAAAAEEREAEWAKGRRPFQNQNAVIAAQVKRIDDLNAALAAEKERADALHHLAKKIGKALLRFTPDGSEYYVKVHDDYYADAEACQRIIQNTRDTQYDVIKKFAAERDAERAARVKAEANRDSWRRVAERLEEEKQDALFAALSGATP